MTRKPSARHLVLKILPEEGYLRFREVRGKVRTLDGSVGESAIRGALRHLALVGWVRSAGGPRSKVWGLTDAGREERRREGGAAK
jgi:DNA-binding PadR family transcriptional regulator